MVERDPLPADGRRRGGVRGRATGRAAGPPDPRVPRPHLRRAARAPPRRPRRAAGGRRPHAADDRRPRRAAARRRGPRGAHRAPHHLRVGAAAGGPRPNPASASAPARPSPGSWPTATATAPPVVTGVHARGRHHASTADVVVASTGLRGDVPGVARRARRRRARDGPRERAHVPLALVPAARVVHGRARPEARRRPRLREVPRRPRRRAARSRSPWPSGPTTARCARRSPIPTASRRPAGSCPGPTSSSGTVRSNRSAASGRWAGCSTGCARFVDDDGRPLVLGFHAVGDAHTCTNPLYGRGCSLALVQALLLAAGARRAPGRRRRAGAWPTRRRADREVRALVRCVGPDGPGRAPTRRARSAATARRARRSAAVFVAAATDPVIGRGLARFWNLLATPARPDGRSGPARPHGRGDGQPRRLPRPRPRRARAAAELLAHLDRRRRPSHERPHRDHERRRAPRRRRGTGGRPAGRPRPRLPRARRTRGATRSRRWPTPGTACSRPTSAGYGRSSRPEAIDDYDIVHLTDDLLGLLDDVGADRAVFVGHDWGSMVVWQLALLHPERVDRGGRDERAVHAPRADAPDRDAAPGHGRQLLLHDLLPGAGRRRRRPRRATRPRRCAGCSAAHRPPATRTPGPRPWPACSPPARRGFVERMPEPDGLPDWLSQEELDHYIAEFTRTGFTGGVNWYRNLDRNWELTRAPRRAPRSRCRRCSSAAPTTRCS